MRFYRSFLVLGALTLSVGYGIAQDLTQKVSFRTAAKPAKLILEELAQSTGVPLVTSPQTAGEILIVAAEGVTLQDLMDRIAEAAGAEWQKDSAGWRLIRSQSLANKQERAYLEDRANRIAAEVATLLKALAAKARFDDSAAKAAYEGEPIRTGQAPNIVVAGPGGAGPQQIELPRNRPDSPIHRALTRMIASMSPGDLAAIGPGARVVYALTPTRVQRALPGKATGVLQAFMNEQAVYVRANADAASAQSGQPGWLIGGQEARPELPQGGVAEALFVVTRPAEGERLTFELRLADRDGRVFAQSTRSMALRPTQPAATPEGSALQDVQLSVSEQSKQHAELLTRMPGAGTAFRFVSAGGGGDFTTSVTVAAPGLPGASASPPPSAEPSADWKAKIARPDAYEPLGFAVSDLFLDFAKAKSKNLVACIPDGALVPLSRRSIQAMPAGELARIAKTDLALGWSDSGSWVVVSPKFPALARAERVDRVALANMLGSVLREGRLSLDALGSYALRRTRQPNRSSFDAIYAGLVNRHAGTTLIRNAQNWKMVQLYASLDPARRKALSDGAVLRLGSLSAFQFGLVSSMAYDDMNGAVRVQSEPPRRPGARNQRQERREMRAAIAMGDDQEGMTFSFGGPMSLADERTEFLPLGLPAEGTLTLRWNRQEAAYASSSSNPSEGQFMTAESYGAMNAIQFAGPAGQRPEYDRFQPASILSMQFSFALPTQGRMSRELEDEALVPGSKPGAFETLPESFRQQAERARASFAERTRNFGDGPPPIVRGGPPPPP